MKMIETISYTATKTVQVTEPSILKVITGGIFSVAFFLFGELHTSALIALLMLMVFDTVLGVTASVHEGKSITSAKFANFLLKAIVYFIAVSSGYYLDTVIGGTFAQGTTIAFVAVTEFISILENIGRMGFATPKRLLNQLKDFQSNK